MDDIELIKEKINVVDVISEYLPLKKSGVNFKALCPFHSERTPSFMVSPERGIWHCFGACNEGGDIFKFLMKKEGMDFKDALEYLAKKAGVVLKERKQDISEKDRLFEVNLKAEQFFQYLLLDHPLGKNALKYLYKRGLNEATIREFGLGYAPLNWESLTKFLLKRGFSIKELILSGLGIPSKRGCYDRFRGRITYPLIDARDRILGFSGRILDKGEPKYINTAQTIIFDKSKFLFGLNLAKSYIKEKQEVILVEGEMDVILSFQVGVKNVVASKGTALTDGQVQLIKKYTSNLSFCFDTDLAGDSAFRRGIEMADAAGLNIKVIKIEDSKDPAELCLKNPNAWKEVIKEAIPIYDFYLTSVIKRFNPKTALGKKEIFAELLPIWKKISNPLIKEHYIQKLSSLLQVKDDLIRDQINKKDFTKISPKVLVNVSEQGKDDRLQPRDRRRLLEEYLLALILHVPENVTYVPNFPETLFTEENLRQIYVLLVLFLDKISFKGKSFKIAEFVKFTPLDLVSLIDKLYLIEIDEKLSLSSPWQKEVGGVVSELKKMLIKASLEKLSLEIKNAQSFEKLDNLEILNKKFRDLSLKLKNL